MFRQDVSGLSIAYSGRGSGVPALLMHCHRVYLTDPGRVAAALQRPARQQAGTVAQLTRPLLSTSWRLCVF